MTDVFTPTKRSEIMRAVKSRGNQTTELKLIAFFRSNGYRGWRRKMRLTGSPDFIFPKEKIAVFVDGCFWHGHACRNTTPASNVGYWRDKIQRNKMRDRRVTRKLRHQGWIVLRCWECKLTDNYLQHKFAKHLKSLAA